jgi:hypothetical protein
MNALSRYDRDWAIPSVRRTRGMEHARHGGFPRSRDADYRRGFELGLLLRDEPGVAAVQPRPTTETDG